MDDDQAKKALIEHVEQHVNYPITKQQIVEACENMSDVSEEEKRMAESLPDQTFESADEVKEALGLTK